MRVPATEFFLCSLLLLCGACGKPTYDVGAFDSYVKQFETEAKQLGRAVHAEDLIVRFGYVKPGAAAVCQKRLAGTPTIILGEAEWKWSTPARRELIMFHELGHCALNRDHKDETVVPDGGVRPIAASMMTSKFLDGETYNRFRDYYLRELFEDI